MNRCVKIGLFSISLLSFLTVNGEEAVPQIWQPGFQYNTNIKYVFKFLDASLRLEESEDKPYRSEGEFRAPEFGFYPLISYVTQGIRKKGNNYYGIRTYNHPTVAFFGGENFKWHRTQNNWKMLWRWHWVNRWRDKDLRDFKKFIDDSAEKSKQKGHLCEVYPVFDVGYDNAPFDSERNALFLEWTDKSLLDFLKGAESGLNIRIGDRGDKPLDGNVRPLAPDAVLDVIRSEWNLSASVLFDTSNTAIRQKRRAWEIDASKLNAFLANEKLKKAVNFSGNITATYKRIPPDQVAEKFGGRIFDAVCIEAKSSEGFKLGFDTGRGRNTSFPVSFGKEENHEGTLELWFDQENELLRYARIKINKKKYKGAIPNPGLGEMISKIGGHIEGEMYFELEYRTEVMPERGVINE